MSENCIPRAGVGVAFCWAFFVKVVLLAMVSSWGINSRFITICNVVCDCAYELYMHVILALNIAPDCHNCSCLFINLIWVFLSFKTS